MSEQTKTVVIPVRMTDNIYTLKGRQKIAQFLNGLIIKNQTRMVKSVLKSCDKKYRKKIIQLKVNRVPLLFEATLVGNLRLVNYLLDECEANVEQTGYCGIVECTSLWVAASQNFVQVVISLLEHGADVNSRSSSQRTVVSIACCSLKLVKYLVKHGADIRIPDCKGRTCLMYSIHWFKICQFLLRNGAHVNRTDKTGKDALHYAIQAGEVESVKVLIKNGADALRTGPKENTPLELSALEYKPFILEYLLGLNCYTSESKANAYELLGSKNPAQRKFYWEKALQIRHQYNLFPKRVPRHRHHQLVKVPLGVEFQTMEDLKEISLHRESMWTQALLTQLRILGPKHPHTIDSFTEKAFYHIFRSEFELGIVLLECMFTLYATHLDSLPNSLFHMMRMLRILDINYGIEHAYQLTCLATSYLSTVVENFLDSRNPTNRQHKLKMVERYLVEILSQLDYILSFSLTTEEQNCRLNLILYNLIRRQPRGQGQVGLLHLAVRMHLSQNVLCRLIQCGVDIDGQDELGNTAVHYAIHRHLFDQQPDTLCCLLDHGCHVDIASNSGYSPLEYVRQNGLLRTPVTLQCMAAKTIQKYQVPYAYILSMDLEEFIKLH